jgi:hypothetical protein
LPILHFVWSQGVRSHRNHRSWAPHNIHGNGTRENITGKTGTSAADRAPVGKPRRLENAGPKYKFQMPSCQAGSIGSQNAAQSKLREQESRYSKHFSCFPTRAQSMLNRAWIRQSRLWISRSQVNSVPRLAAGDMPESNSTIDRVGQIGKGPIIRGDNRCASTEDGFWAQLPTRSFLFDRAVNSVHKSFPIWAFK